MKKVVILFVIILLCENAFTQSIEPNISVVIKSKNGCLLKISYDYDDVYNEIPYIKITIDKAINVVTLKSNSTDREEMFLNKNMKYLVFNDYKTSSILTNDTEKMLIKSEYDEIVFYDASMDGTSYQIKDIVNSINAIKECFNVFKNNYIKVASEKKIFLDECIKKSNLYIKKFYSDEYPKIYINKNDTWVLLDECISIDSRKFKLDSNLFRYISYGAINSIKVLKEFEGVMVILEYETKEIDSVLKGNYSAIEVIPVSANYAF